MNLIINHTSMEPIYEQIIAQIKAGIINGTLVSGEALLMEERRRELEKELEAAVRKARIGGLTAQEICETFQIIMEDGEC